MNDDSPLIWISPLASERINFEVGGTFDSDARTYIARGEIFVNGNIVVLTREEYERLQSSAED